jgi:hypothetical protein
MDLDVEAQAADGVANQIGYFINLPHQPRNLIPDFLSLV